MREFNFKAYLEKKQKLDYVISKEEYVTGQTWCILKKQHVCLYFFALFFACFSACLNLPYGRLR